MFDGIHVYKLSSITFVVIAIALTSLVCLLIWLGLGADERRRRALREAQRQQANGVRMAMRVARVSVWRSVGPDVVTLHYDGPSPYPALGWSMSAKFQTAHGYAEEFLAKVGVPPRLIEVHDTRTKLQLERQRVGRYQ